MLGEPCPTAHGAELLRALPRPGYADDLVGGTVAEEHVQACSALEHGPPLGVPHAADEASQAHDLGAEEPKAGRSARKPQRQPRCHAPALREAQDSNTRGWDAACDSQQLQELDPARLYLLHRVHALIWVPRLPDPVPRGPHAGVRRPRGGRGRKQQRVGQLRGELPGQALEHAARLEEAVQQEDGAGGRPLPRHQRQQGPHGVARVDHRVVTGGRRELLHGSRLEALLW
mmetsp:Transcript_90283/g.264109  ORF Transcript_90283/g.264109 Transcript_90283/m.264109 type:complete len:230 (-) Transcript_90283:705-1394(-)